MKQADVTRPNNGPVVVLRIVNDHDDAFTVRTSVTSAVMLAHQLLAAAVDPQ